jgi:carbamoyltransferase
LRILGISAFYHDSAAAIVVDGKIVAAAQEERFTRTKHDPGFPANAIKFCLSSGDIRLVDLDHVVFYDKPFLKFERLLETYLAFAPRGFRSFQMAVPLWIKEKLFQKDLLHKELAAIESGSESRRVSVLSLALRRGSCSHDRRGRRMVHDIGRCRLGL